MGEKRNRLYLMNWWCTYYNRPLKDPLLQQYSTEELAYEYYLISELQVVKEEKARAEDDRIEEAQLQEAEDWADMMEAEEEAERQAEEERKKLEKAKAEQEEWMQKEIEKNKLFFGDDFGEDVSLDFKDDD
jgi:fumarylacetoacetate (FAA) hydrolase family protein